MNSGEWRVSAEWQPIDTAPKDGSHILVTDRRPDGASFGMYDGVRVPWSAVAHWWNDGSPEMSGFYLSSGDQGAWPLRGLTHWMPIP